MGVVQAPPVSVSAVLLGGLATAVFPSKPYRRVVILVDMQNTVTGKSTIYTGSISGAFKRVASNPQGSNQQWTTPFNVPAGQGVFIQWTSAPSPVSDARATITWKEEQVVSGIQDRRLYGTG
jgi:hypothetical protein